MGNETTFEEQPRVPREVLVRRSDPVYNAHSYLTKVPVRAITPFVELLCPPGGTVLDPFAGSGMTGVAAAMTGRSALLSDIGVLGRHIGLNYVNLVDRGSFESAVNAVSDRAQEQLKEDPYRVPCARCRRDATLIRSVWTVVFGCSKCGGDISYYDALEANAWRKGSMSCPGCGCRFETRNAERRGERRVLDVVSCSCTSVQQEQPPHAMSTLTPESAGVAVPDVAITADREMFSRSALAKHGLTEVRSFFSDRNLAVLGALRAAIEQVEDRALHDKLMFVFTAILARASKRYQWSRKRPLNASNQTYYIAPVFYEWNVIDLYKRKARAVLRSDEAVEIESASHGAGNPRVRYEVSSATRLSHVADESVDYVFTDPPFGSNIFYSDMNLFGEAWLEGLTDQTQEAVVHTTAARRADAAGRYEGLLSEAFRECRRVLRVGGWMTVVFSSTNGEMWALLQRALASAQFMADPDGITVLDKGQRSVRA